MANDKTIAVNKDQHWLKRPRSIRLLWKIFIGILALTLVFDTLVHQHDYFGIEDSFGFFAWYGFITCIVMVLTAKLLGILIKRTDSYYDD